MKLILSVQWLRALAVMMVVIYHILLKAELLGLTSISFSIGAAGVDLFFIISGFIMVHITYDKSYGVAEFIKKRVFRIIPLYWILTALATFVYILQPSLVNSHNGETTIIGSYTLFPVSGTVMLLAVAWTLQYEFIFYFIFAAFLSFNKNRYFFSSISILAIFLFGLTKPNNYFLSFISNPILIEFTYGMIAFFILKHTKPNTTLCVTLGLALFYVFYKLGFTLEHRYIGFGIPMLLIFIGIASIKNDSVNSNSRILKFITYIGNASYSIYLTHIFSIAITVLSLRKAMLLSSPQLFIVLSTILSTLAGLLCYALVEKKLSACVKFKSMS